MADSSRNLQHKILKFKYHRAREYDLDGDKVDTDEFIYDSDISVEDKVSVSRLGKAVEKQKTVKRGGVSGQVPAEKKIDPTRAAPRVSTLNKSSTPSNSHVRLVPDPSVDGRKIEEIREAPIFLDGSPIAPSKYEAIFESARMQ